MICKALTTSVCNGVRAKRSNNEGFLLIFKSHIRTYCITFVDSIWERETTP